MRLQLVLDLFPLQTCVSLIKQSVEVEPATLETVDITVHVLLTLAIRSLTALVNSTDHLSPAVMKSVFALYKKRTLI